MHPALCHTWNSVCIWSILPIESDRIGFEAVICRVAANTGQLLTSFVTVFTLCDMVVLAFVQTFCITQNIRSCLGPPYTGCKSMYTKVIASCQIWDLRTNTHKPANAGPPDNQTASATTIAARIEPITFKAGIVFQTSVGMNFL
jgi:hypothetical protein